MRIRVLPYKPTSESARELSRALGCLRLRSFVRTKFRPRDGDVIVNWGYSGPLPPAYLNGRVRYLNLPFNVAKARDKIQTFIELKAHNVPTVEWTRDRNVAQDWLDTGERVVVRHSTTGQGGSGIQVVSEGEVPEAPLYTKYFRRDAEYRVHVLADQVLDVQQKKMRRQTREETKTGVRDRKSTYEVRNLANGWVFTREGVVCPGSAADAATAGVAALGLSFGAVDIAVRDDESRVLEINTAPGIEGASVGTYAYAIRKHIG